MTEFQITFDEYAAEVPAQHGVLRSGFNPQGSTPRLRDAERIDRVSDYLQKMAAEGDQADEAVAIKLLAELTAINDSMPLTEAARLCELLVVGCDNLDEADRARRTGHLFLLGEMDTPESITQVTITSWDGKMDAYRAERRAAYAKLAGQNAGVIAIELGYVD
jgi:hypothetical protein